MGHGKAVKVGDAGKYLAHEAAGIPFPADGRAKGDQSGQKARDDNKRKGTNCLLKLALEV